MKIGFFGKLPGYGDFVQRNVSPDLAEYWDNWVMQSIDTAQMQLQGQWREVYFTSPVWRFTVQQGIVSESTLSGLMMPSVDSAGRDYPFFVFCEFSEPQNVFLVSSEMDPLHIKNEEFVIGLLSMPRPDLDEIVSVIKRNYSKYAPPHTYKCLNSDQLQGAELVTISAPSEVNCMMAHYQFAQALLGCVDKPISVWSHSASEHFDAEQRYFRGMPPVDCFSSLLLGK